MRQIRAVRDFQCGLRRSGVAIGAQRVDQLASRRDEGQAGLVLRAEQFGFQAKGWVVLPVLDARQVLGLQTFELTPHLVQRRRLLEALR